MNTRLFQTYAVRKVITLDSIWDFHTLDEEEKTRRV